MSAVRRIAILLAIALVLTLASSRVYRTRLEVQDWDCPPPPASCARPMLVAGFPLPYISDYHGISTGNSATLTGAVLGEDLFHRAAFLTDLGVYFLLAWAVAAAVRAARARPARVAPNENA
jgi:hypothetical protein